MDVHAFSGDGKNVLMHMVQQETYNEGCMRLLLEAGADVNAANAEGETALFHAMRYFGENCVPSLVAAGADTESTVPGGKTPLMLAAEHNLGTCMSLLLAVGAKVDAQDDHGRTALMRAKARATRTFAHACCRRVRVRGLRMPAISVPSRDVDGIAFCAFRGFCVQAAHINVAGAQPIGA